MSSHGQKPIITAFIAVLAAFFSFLGEPTTAQAQWNGIVQARLKSAQPFDWSAQDQFFTGHERAEIEYYHESKSFRGVIKLNKFKQAGPYVLTVDTADETIFAGYGCVVWVPWTQLYGETFPGGTNGCWYGSPYVDVKLFFLEQYDSNHDGVIGGGDYYSGTVHFDVPLLNGTYNLKFFVKLDWNLTSPHENIVMMNNMDGNRRYGKVNKPRRGFDYDRDLIIESGLGAERLVLADSAWCEPGCDPPSSDPGYTGTTGVVFYSTLAETFEGAVVLSQTVPQLLQIKLEGMGSQSAFSESNEKLGHIGRWWDDGPTFTGNITDAQYESVKLTDNVLGYVIFDGLDTDETFKTFSLESSYHVLWTPQSGRLPPGSVVMEEGHYVANFALTENLSPWRGIFLSENPLEFEIAAP